MAESRDVRGLSEKILSIIIGHSSSWVYLGPREELEKMMGTTQGCVWARQGCGTRRDTFTFVYIRPDA